MKKSKRIMVFVIAAFMVLTLLVGCKDNPNNEVGQNGNEVIQENNNGEIAELPQDQDEAETVKLIEYASLEELLPEYSIENAIEDKCFVITRDNELYNDNVLQGFENSLSASVPTNIRVVMETSDEKLSIMDISCSGDEIKVVQDDTRLAGNIQENMYYVSEGYTFSDQPILLEDGNSVKIYELVNANMEEKIELFGYLIAPNTEIDESGEADNLENDILSEAEIIESGE